MNVRASYLPILLNENHWVGSTILNETKEILVYNPSGADEDNKLILNNLLRLVGDEFKRQGNVGDNEVLSFQEKWSLFDVSKHGSANGYPCQENGEYHKCQHL